MPTCVRPTVPEDLEPLPRHRALLFDWDGTLADSQQVNHVALDRALREQGAYLDRDWFDARTGLSTHDLAAGVSASLGVPLDVPAVTDSRDRWYLDQVHLVGEVAVVADLLRRQGGLRRRALATGGGRRTVLATARRLGLLDLFDAVVTRDDVSHGKPAPDLFLLAAERLQVAPGHCLVYEDSDEGLAAAAAAGMDAVDVRPLRPPQPG